MFKSNLENLIYSFKSIMNISKGISNLDPDYEKAVFEIPNVIEKIRDLKI